MSRFIFPSSPHMLNNETFVLFLFSRLIVKRKRSDECLSGSHKWWGWNFLYGGFIGCEYEQVRKRACRWSWIIEIPLLSISSHTVLARFNVVLISYKIHRDTHNIRDASISIAKCAKKWKYEFSFFFFFFSFFCFFKYKITFARVIYIVSISLQLSFLKEDRVHASAFFFEIQKRIIFFFFLL